MENGWRPMIPYGSWGKKIARAMAELFKVHEIRYINSRIQVIFPPYSAYTFSRGGGMISPPRG